MIKGKRKVGKPKIAFSDQIRKKVKVNSYKKVKDLVRDREEWRRLH